MLTCRTSALTAPVSKLTKQVQVQKKRKPDCPKTDPKVDGNHERFGKNQCIGITRGGRNTKIHVVVDALGNPIHVQLSSGDIHDSIIAEYIKLSETTVLADKAYGSFALREYIHCQSGYRFLYSTEVKLSRSMVLRLGSVQGTSSGRIPLQQIEGES